MHHVETKPQLSFASLWCLSLGFLGIQFGWGLQMANMSAIYQMLGAHESEIALLWIAAPITGFFVQPIIGYMSDRTWGRFGRRKPYFFVGAIISSLALVAMPNSGSLWMAVGLLWVLDGAINATMQPFRAFVGDVLPENQQAVGFSVQTVLIGIGAMISSSLLWILAHFFGVSSEAQGDSAMPQTVEYAFYLGAIVLFVSVMITIFTTKEYPPQDMEKFARDHDASHGFLAGVKEVWGLAKAMPKRMKQLAWVQMFSWSGLFCMWTYFAPYVTANVFGATGTKDPLYEQGLEWAGVCFSTYNGVALVVAFALIGLVKKYSPKHIHMVSLFVGGMGLMGTMVVTDPNHLLICMVGVGIAWASILSMPYAMIARSIPEGHMGVYMGLFNIFIVIPQVIIALFSGTIVTYMLDGNSSAMVPIGGVLCVLAAFCVCAVDADEQPFAGALQGSSGH